MSAVTETVLKGTNWEFIPEFIDSEKAKRAGAELLELIGGGSNSVELGMGYRDLGYKVYHTRFITPMCGPEHREWQARTAPNFVDVHTKIAEFREKRFPGQQLSKLGTGYVNVLEPGGRISAHRDSEPGGLMFVSFMGEAEITIEDSLTLDVYTQTSVPGSALFFDNPEHIVLRSEHSVLNLGGLKRVSYGEYLSSL